jgi:hypothetical protein
LVVQNKLVFTHFVELYGQNPFKCIKVELFVCRLGMQYWYGVLHHTFILHIVISFIWGIGLGLCEFLDNSCEQLDFTITAIGAVAKLVLQEQTYKSWQYP